MSRQQRRHRITSMFAVVSTLWVCLAMPSQAMAEGNRGAKKFAGTYLLEVVFDDGSRFPGQFILTRDGGLIASQINPNPGVDLSGFLGVWERVEGRQVNIVFLGFITTEDGIHVSTAKINITAEFDEDFQTFEGPGFVEVFDPTQNPLDPNEIPFPGGTNTVSGERISIGDGDPDDDDDDDDDD